MTTFLLSFIFNSMSSNIEEEKNVFCFFTQTEEDEKNKERLYYTLHTLDVTNSENLKVIEDFIFEKQKDPLLKNTTIQEIYKLRRSLTYHTIYIEYCGDEVVVKTLIKQLYHYAINKCSDELLNNDEYLVDDSLHFTFNK